jgi:hypothetical protein
MRMRFQLSVISVLTILPLAVLATPLASPWDDVRVMHAWDAVPENWDNLGPPHSNTTIDLFVALKAHNENALIDALYEVSTPGHPKYGLSNTHPGTMYLYVASPLQIWRPLVKGGGR